ncbi:MAG: hypothetical protein ABFD83_01435 [Armatimonadota bacterium]
MKVIFASALAIYMLAASLASYAATAYTGSAPFNTAISGFAFSKVFDFDSYTAGTSVTACGMAAISAQGLDCDGATTIDLQPVAADAYSTGSTPISVGVSGSENQFLAGNGDHITFGFSRPIHAFGIYLIGNPSPTGDPAIPFWKMHASSGFDAYSATEPIQSLSLGNDVYFLGIVSPGSPFSQINLYSDNDPAAVYSFSVDNMILAADVPQLTLAEAKTNASGDFVVSDIIVTRVHADRFNVEKSDWSGGMAVLGGGTSRDKAVSLFGTIQDTGDDEHVLKLVQLMNEADSTAPTALGMSCKSVGGGSSVGLQIGCTGSVGPNNIGLDVVAWGKVTAYDTTLAHAWITIDDGSHRDSGMGSLGVKVEGPVWGDGRYIGEMVRVQGSSSLFKSGSDHYPLIRLAESGDITPFTGSSY